MPRPVTHLANLDLNLLIALRERSLTHAAEWLGVAAPGQRPRCTLPRR